MREAREKERELKELDRDIRTVFAYNLPLKADERNLFEFFSKGGTVEDVRIIMDRNTRRSKGFAYIEYASRVRSEVHVRFLCIYSRLYLSGSAAHSHLPCVLHACVLGSREPLPVLAILGAGWHGANPDDYLTDWRPADFGALLDCAQGGRGERAVADRADPDGPGHHGQEL